LLWPFSRLPETPVLARVPGFVRKAASARKPRFRRFFRSLCSPFSVSVNDLTEFWTVNWKYRDAPYDNTLHGGHDAQERGEVLYKQLNAKGEFATCMGAKKGNLKGLRLSYPRFDKDMGGIIGMEAKIEACAAKQGMKLDNGSYDNTAVSVYITAFSNQMPLKRRDQGAHEERL
jgi:sulfur-oxidizing protein SoxA